MTHEQEIEMEKDLEELERERLEGAKDLLMRQCRYEGVKRAVYREALEAYFRLIK